MPAAAVADTTLVTAPGPGVLSPLEAGVMDACNALHEARAMGDGAAVEDLRAHVLALLDRYDASDGENHRNPAWARPNQRALAMSALGDVEAAIRLETAALKYADTPRRREISLGNLAERCIRAGRPEEAVGWFLGAYEAAPESVPVLLTGAQALHLTGCSAEADAIFAAFLDDPSHLLPQSELGAYLEYEPRLRAMAGALPSLAALFARWEAARGAAGRGGAR